MSDPAVQIVAALVEAGVTGLMGLLSADGQAAVRDQLAAARARLPAAGSTVSAVDAVVARHVATRHPRVTHATADVLSRLAHQRGLDLTGEDRAALDVALPALRALADAGELPAVLGTGTP